MKQFVIEQHEEVCKATVGFGQYKLRNEYQHLAIAHSHWFTGLTSGIK